MKIVGFAGWVAASMKQIVAVNKDSKIHFIRAAISFINMVRAVAGDFGPDESYNIQIFLVPCHSRALGIILTLTYPYGAPTFLRNAFFHPLHVDLLY